MKKLSIIICICLVFSCFANISTIGAKSKKIKLNKTSISITVGGQSKLKVKNNSKKVKWKSKNSKVATVSSKGVVKGKKTGKTTIIAKVGKKKLSCKVTVKSANASKSNSNGWLYIEHSSTVTITGYTGKESNITLPASINGKKVIAIMDNAFYGCLTIKNVVIPEGIVWYGENTFFECKNLETAQLPSSLEGGFYGFISPLFNGCDKLKQVRVKKGSKIEEYMKYQYGDKVVYY